MRTLGLVLVAALAACSSSSPSPRTLDSGEAAKLLVDRDWIDRMPETHTDRLQVYRFVPSMGGGVFQDRTIFKGTFELFTFTVEGEQLKLKLPETRTKVATRWSIQEVAGPKPFNLKLTISDDPRGGGVYFGIRGKTDRDGAGLDAMLAGIGGGE
jgi:hypothetical protein